MSANTRPWKKDVTPGEWVLDWGGHLYSPSNLQLVVVVQHSPSTQANVALIKEATKTLHQTGMTPGELAEQNAALAARVRELEGVVKYTLDSIGVDDYGDHCLVSLFEISRLESALEGRH